MSYGINLNGPALEPLRKQLVDWAMDVKQMLYKNLTEDHPYGSVKLTSVEQWQRFTQMQPQDYQMVISMLEEKYRGLPNSYDLVNRDLAAFLSHMMTLGINFAGNNAIAQTPPVAPTSMGGYPNANAQ